MAEISDGSQVGQAQGMVLESLEVERQALLEELEKSKKQLDDELKEMEETAKVTFF